MDTQGSTPHSTGHDETDRVATVPVTDTAETEKKLDAIISEEDQIRQMTLNTANVIPKPAQTQNTGVVTKQPGVAPRMKPENYVIKPENLGEAPDYIDCPYCKSRQKTEVRHQPTSQTSYVALFTN